MNKLIFRFSARLDFDAIADFIAENDEERALSFINELQNACRNRANFPHSGRDCSNIAPNLRRFTYENYVIYYFPLPNGGGIEIVHVVHGARDHERILRDDLTP